MSRFKEIKGEWLRFSTIVESIKGEHNYEYLITCMTFINSVVNFPKEVEVRVSLRNEFVRLGLLEIISNIRNNYEHDEELEEHMNIFDEFMQSDNVEVNKHLASLDGIDMNDPSQIFEAMKKKATGSSYYNSFLFLLQSIIKLTADVTVGMKVWQVFEKIMCQYLDLQKYGLSDDEVLSLGTESSSNLNRVKKEMQSEVDALNKMLQATLNQLSSVKKERDEKAQMLSSYMKVKQAERIGLDEALGRAKSTQERLVKELKYQMDPSKSMIAHQLQELIQENESLKKHVDIITQELLSVRSLKSTIDGRSVAVLGRSCSIFINLFMCIRNS